MEIVVLLWLLQLLPACPAEGWVTSKYGYRTDPIHHRRKFHRGIDIANKAGTPVYAPWTGRVLKVGRDRFSGRFIVLLVGDMRITFMHLQETTVSRGQMVRRGGQVGLMGSSGRATGPHLHLEMQYQWRPQNPSLALLRCPVKP